MSPQIILKYDYTYKCDIWSLGIILYQLLYHKHPINEIDELYIDSTLYHCENISIGFDSSITKSTNSLLASMLSYYELDRPSWRELKDLISTSLKQTPWITIYQILFKLLVLIQNLNCIYSLFAQYNFTKNFHKNFDLLEQISQKLIYFPKINCVSVKFI